MTEVVERAVEERLVRVSAGPVTLEGDLSLPEGAGAIVLFAHGGILGGLEQLRTRTGRNR